MTEAAQALTGAAKLAGRPAPLEVIAIRRPKDRDRFIEFQLELYGEDPNYVPPIVAERRDFLDRNKNPFLSHAEIELFLAKRNGEIVGRVAAIHDENHNLFYNSDHGLFGMFEAIDDPEVASALFDAAGDWIRGRGLERMLGPFNLSSNHDCGLLVQGFDSPPSMMMPYNFSYFPRLLETCGFAKFKDLWSYEIATSAAPAERSLSRARQIEEQGRIRVRSLDVKRLGEEVRQLKGIYDTMVDPQWGFVPMSEEEFDHIAARLKPLVLLRPELCLIAEDKGQPVAFCLTLPDSNVALKAAGGHLTWFGLPFGLARMLWAARGTDRLRVLLFGVRPSYQKQGIEALLFVKTMKLARELGFNWAEIGWTTEDNESINKAIELMGARRYKTYRLYEKAI